MSRLTQYAYDLSGNIVKKTLANGLAEVRSHDGRNRVSMLDNQPSGGSNVAGYAYGYDRAGNVMEVEETYPSGSLDDRTIVNTYDGVYRLLSEAITTGGDTVTTTYIYDKGHNRTSKAVSGGATTTYVIGDGDNGAGANQIVSATTGGVTTDYAYDANGNRESRTVDDNTDTYSYDDENRLINLDYQTGESGTGTYGYAYDYRTRRTARTEPGPVSTHIVFDGGISILEYGPSGATSPNVEYVRGHDYGGGVGGLEYSVRSGAAKFNGYDSRGDVTTQTDATGAVTYQTAYKAFGDQTVTSGSTLDRQKANTKEEDPTGLLNEGFRYRDPDTGTFLTRDPLGFKAGPNMYCYVHQNPWTHFDPEGLFPDAQMMWDQPHNQQEINARNQAGLRIMGPLVVGTAVSAAVVLAAPEVAGVGVVSTLARLSTAGIAGSSGGAATQMTHNALIGQPISTNVGPAMAGGAVTGVALQGASQALGALSKTAAPASPTASARTTGTATVMEHPGDPAHYSVQVDSGGTSIHTHQAVTGPSSTSIVTPATVPTGPVVASGTVNLPNAPAAQAAQKSMMAAGDTGPYHPVTNSCVSHVSSVLEAGGVKTPPPGVPNSVAQWKNLRKIVNPPPPPPPKQKQ